MPDMNEQRSWEIDICACAGMTWDPIDRGARCLVCDQEVRRITVYEQPEALRQEFEETLWVAGLAWSKKREALETRLEQVEAAGERLDLEAAGFSGVLHGLYDEDPDPEYATAIDNIEQARSAWRTLHPKEKE